MSMFIEGGNFFRAWTLKGVILGGMDIEGGHFEVAGQVFEVVFRF